MVAALDTVYINGIIGMSGEEPGRKSTKTDATVMAMTIKAEDVEGIARQAIAVNWHSRNTRVFDCPARHERTKRTRRSQLREWVAALRVAMDAGNLEFVRARLLNSGPLMGHDLRNRVIVAGLDRRIENAKGQSCKQQNCCKS
ncbi:MAG: hypothetical protein I4O49_05845 [Janthinobacterium lividum]|nr:hypothetical protein [Janthinobacterium lividum]